MNKVLIIIGLIMMSLGFSRVAKAEAFLTATRDFQILEQVPYTQVSNNCALFHNKFTEPRIIKERSIYDVKNYETVNPFLKEIEEKIGSKKSHSSFASIKEDAKNIGITMLSAEEYLNSSKYFDVYAGSEIDMLGGHKTVRNYKQLQMEIESLGGRVSSAENILNSTKEEIITVSSVKTKTQYTIHCMPNSEQQKPFDALKEGGIFDVVTEMDEL